MVPRRLGVLSISECLGQPEHRSAKTHDSGISAGQMLARAIGDAALALLNHRVLLSHAAHAAEGRGLLIGTIDLVVVGQVAQRDVMLVDFGHHTVAGA